MLEVIGAFLSNLWAQAMDRAKEKSYWLAIVLVLVALAAGFGIIKILISPLWLLLVAAGAVLYHEYKNP